jgi:hypothetical protein
MAVAYNPKIVTNGLVLALDAANIRSYPRSGTAWTDLSGLGNNGTLVNGPSFDSGNGGSILFDGTNDYVTLGTPVSLRGLQVPLTITAWARANGVTAGNTLYGIYGGLTGGRLYSLFRVDNGVLVYFTTNSSGGYQWQTSFTVTTGVWNFYAVIVSGTISSPSVKYFLNQSSQSFNYSALSSSPDTSVDIRVGGNASVPGEAWDGYIGQLSVYNRALSDQEILSNFNATRGRYGI